MDLALSVEIETAEGRLFRWGGSSSAANRPLSLQFGTQRGDGFSTFSAELRRDLVGEYADLNLLDRLRVIDSTGSIAWEGRISAFPRSSSPEGDRIGVQAVGLMSSARDRSFREIYLDRDLKRWQGASRARQLAILAASVKGYGEPRIENDETTGKPGIALDAPDGIWIASYGPQVEAWYDAGPGLEIGYVYAEWERLSTTTATTFDWRIATYDDDLANGGGVTADLQNEPNATGTREWEPDASQAGRWARLRFLWSSTAAGGFDGFKFGVRWTNVIVRSTHADDEVPVVGTLPDVGVTASSVIADLCARFCPELVPSGVEPTSYGIKQVAYHAPTVPHEAFLELNRYHLWELAVWEGGALHFHEPSPLDAHDWEVRLSDRGVSAELQGDSIDNLANGITVEFDDLALGSRRSINPETNAVLADDSEENPANARGIERWIDLSVPFPTIEDDAEQIGRAALAEFSSVRAAGSISVAGEIRNAAGQARPVWEVRAGDRIVIADHPNDAPRRVVATSYSHDGRVIQITTDNQPHRLDALFDRVANARSAAGLGG